ncbi:hypothetical protein CC79DRAFT_753515 [Sarocladium strictum]
MMQKKAGHACPGRRRSQAAKGSRKMVVASVRYERVPAGDYTALHSGALRRSDFPKTLLDVDMYSEIWLVSLPSPESQYRHGVAIVKVDRGAWLERASTFDVLPRRHGPFVAARAIASSLFANRVSRTPSLEATTIHAEPPRTYPSFGCRWNNP